MSVDPLTFGKLNPGQTSPSSSQPWTEGSLEKWFLPTITERGFKWDCRSTQERPLVWAGVGTENDFWGKTCLSYILKEASRAEVHFWPRGDKVQRWVSFRAPFLKVPLQIFALEHSWQNYYVKEAETAYFRLCSHTFSIISIQLCLFIARKGP